MECNLKTLVSLIAGWGLFFVAQHGRSQTSVVPSGTGSAESPYQITQIGHLVWMDQTVEESAGKHYRLMNDIDASETAGWNEGMGFHCIGRAYMLDLDFRGEFDGAGHVIRGLVCSGGHGGDEAGLFGELGSGCRVENLAIIGGHFLSLSAQVGGIAAVNRGGVVRNCLVATVVSAGLGGSIVGENGEGVIERCVATGTVQSDGWCGGVVGYHGGGVITQCYSSVFMDGGGLRGIVGESNGSAILESYWDIQSARVADTGLGGVGKSLAEMCHAETFAGWDFTNVWGVTEGSSTPYLNAFQPPFTLSVVTQGVGRIEIVPQKSAYLPGERVTLTAFSDAPGYVFSHWAGGESNLLTTVTTVAMTGHRALLAVFVPAIEISTVDELQAMGGANNYRLVQDIDASATTNWNGGAGFVAIGNYLNAFTGILDGNGHVIRGLTVKGDTLGVFGAVYAGAVIRRVGVVGGAMEGGCGGVFAQCMEDSTIEECYSCCDLTAEACAGGLVGDCSGLLVDCHATGIVKSEQGRAGGLVGLNGRNSYGGIVQDAGFRITRCYATGDVIGGSYSECVGGLVGVNAGTIDECFASGNVSGYQKVGGLVGDNEMGTRRCFATGSVKGAYLVGGLFGMALDISWENGGPSAIGECFSTGSVTGTDCWSYIGGWSGSHEFNSQPPIYWDFDASWQARQLTYMPHWGYRDGMQMKRQSTYEGWDFDSIWAIDEGITYPYLSSVGRSFLLNVQTVGEGVVTVSPLKASYEPGEIVSVNAKPANGSHVFVGWKGAVADEDDAATVVTMDTHRTLTARFGGPVTDVETVEELQLIGNDQAYPLSGCYRLACDIAASATTNWNDGQGFSPIGCNFEYFSGVFDGNGHTVDGISINRPQESGVGLFGSVSPEGVVRGLRMTNVSVVGAEAVGSVAGENCGRVARCEVSGTVVGSGLVGGIIGLNRLGIVKGSSVNGNVKGQHFVGGVAGAAEFSCVDQCYAACSLDCADFSGGVLGLDELYGEVRCSYWDVETSGCAVSAGGEGKTTAEMMRQETYVGWDFSTEWGIDEGAGYPFLWRFRLTLPPGVGAADGTNRPAYAAWAAAHTNAWGTADFSGVPSQDFEKAWLLDQRPESGFSGTVGLAVSRFEVGDAEIRVTLALTAAGEPKHGPVNGCLAIQGKTSLSGAWEYVATQQADDARLSFVDGASTVVFARPAGFAFFRPVLLPFNAVVTSPLRQDPL